MKTNQSRAVSSWEIGMNRAGLEVNLIRVYKSGIALLDTLISDTRAINNAGSAVSC